MQAGDQLLSALLIHELMILPVLNLDESHKINRVSFTRVLVFEWG